MRDYQKLYENIKAFHKLKPWEKMKDTDVVGIKYSDRKEPVFFALDGLDEDSIGLSVFRDVSEYILYLDLLESEFTDADGIGEYTEKLKNIRLEFVDRSKLEEIDYNRIRTTDVKFRGKKAWPELLDFTPGLVPWSATEEDITLFERVLESFLEMFPIYSKLDFDKSFAADDVPTRYYYQAGTKDSVWKLKEEHILAFLTGGELTKGPYDLMLSQFEIRRLMMEKKTFLRNTFEIDLFYLPQPITFKEGERPRFVKMMAIADKKSGEVLLATVLASDKSRDIQFELYKYLFEAKVFPAKIEMRGDSVLETYEMLVPLLDELDIAHAEKSRLRKIEAFRKSLSEDIF